VRRLIVEGSRPPVREPLPETASPFPPDAAAPLRRAAERHAEGMVDFLQRLIRTPGLPGDEAGTADLVRAEMAALGCYADVDVDAAGNVIGRVAGGSGASVMLNTHLDHVDVGDPARWPVPPFEGARQGGAVWGRGAMDIKGPLAAQVYAPAVLRAAGLQPPGELYVTCVVMEEVGGVGAQLLVEDLRPDIAVVGEATAGRLARGHRGRVELEVTFRGRSAHASAPERGANPHYAAARFLTALEALPMAADPELGGATVAPTLVRTDQVSPNVIPSEMTLTLDWRVVPGEDERAVVERLRPLAEAACPPGISASVGVRRTTWRTYTGLERALPSIAPAFLRGADDPLVLRAGDILAGVSGAPVTTFLWRFATDGGHFHAAGIPTIGYGPGDETLAHTIEERIDLDDLVAGLVGNAALAARLGEMNG
jgi:putative selenium metabolism hydrolase